MILRFLLSPWIFYFLAILGLILAIVLVMKGKKQLITAKVLEDEQNNAAFVYDLICAEFPSACVLKEAPIASTSTGSIQITQTVDILYISRGGVVIISVINGDGAYDNPKTGPWRYRYPGSNGKPVTVSMPNPFDTSIPASNILEGLLVGEKIYVDVKRIAVFTAEKLGMTTKYPEAMTLDALLPYLHSLNLHAVMNGPQFRTASEVITAYAQYNQHKILTSKHGTDTKATYTDTDSKSTKATHGSVSAHNADVITPEMLDDDEAVKLLKEVQSEIDKESAEDNE